VSRNAIFEVLSESPPNRAARRHPEEHRPPLDVPGAAEYLGVGERFVRRLIQERRVPHFKLGSKVRLSPEDLDHLLAQARREAQS
jgi:excisionase family DNA binding protein